MYSSFKQIIFILLVMFSVSAFAVDQSKVKEKWHTPFDLYVNAQEAYEMKSADKDGVLLLDVRNRPEIQYIGMANLVDANIPMYFQKKNFEWKEKKDGVHGSFRKSKNKNFATAVGNVIQSKGLTRETPIIIMCTSGSRAPYAAKALHKAGYKKVYTQIEGFEGIKAKDGPNKGQRIVNGWKNHNLPWSYKLPTSKMYFNFDPEVLKKDKPEEKSE